LKTFYHSLENQILDIKNNGLYKEERVIFSPQDSTIRLSGNREVINFCANNYLGLSNNPELVNAAGNALKNYGYGLSSVRFICGTQNIHKDLEKALSDFLGKEDTILYSSCFDANGGLFETILGPEDAVISDSLNHASIIDGIRLCKAKRFRYANNNMQDLESQLQEASNCRFRLIATDGIFSMDGIVADLKSICDLADKYDALVMVDDSHGVGFMGNNGRGTHEYCDVLDRVDIITGTLGKAMGGASGGYTAGKKEVIEWLRQRSRPYLFSNSLAPVITATALKTLEIIKSDSTSRKRLQDNTSYFRKALTREGFNIIEGVHPIVPLMIGDALLAGKIAEGLLKRGIYVISFSYPVVPEGSARIRFQVSAAHSREQLDKTIKALIEVGKETGLLS
jgi:glycine C-acetyltransferase